MNKRIGQLAEQAGLLGPTSRVGNSHEATEKFAELIVRECIDLALGSSHREDDMVAMAEADARYAERFKE